MKKILCLLLVTPLVCKLIETDYKYIWRCENNEVVCYMFSSYKEGGGISCKFKEQNDVADDESL